MTKEEIIARFKKQRLARNKPIKSLIELIEELGKNEEEMLSQGEKKD